MRSIFHSVSSKLAIAMLACGLLATGCVTPQVDSEGAEADSAQEPSARPDGKVLYRGMVFGVGPAQRLFPEIWENQVVQKKITVSLEAREKAADHVVAYIARQDPTFFERFAQDLSSGDRESITAMLAETRDQTIPAMKDLSKSLGVQSGGPQSPGSDRSLGVWFAGSYAVAYDIALVVVAIGVLAFAVTPADGAQTHLQNDEWVDALAKRDMRLPASL